MLKLDSDMEEKLEKFTIEARIKLIASSSFSLLGSKIFQDAFDMVFRDLRTKVIVTYLTTRGIGWEVWLLNMSGSVGMMACIILSFSKFVLNKEPKTIYLERNIQTNSANITAEWYKEDDTDIDDLRAMTQKMFGFKTERIIQFKDVIEEAKRFLDEQYEQRGEEVR
jgi:hypothetical protein